MENNLKNSTVFTFFLDHIYWSSNGSPSIQMKLERGMLSWAAVFAFCRCEFRLKLLYTSVELRVPSIDENAFSQPALLPLPGSNHCDLLGLPISFLFATSWCRQQDLHRGGLLSWWVGTVYPIVGNVWLLNLTVRTRNKLRIQIQIQILSQGNWVFVYDYLLKKTEIFNFPQRMAIGCLHWPAMEILKICSTTPRMSQYWWWRWWYYHHLSRWTGHH